MIQLSSERISNCIYEFRKAGFDKSEYSLFDEIKPALLKLIEIQCDFFSSEISKMKSPRDIIAFLVQYESENKSNDGDVAFKKL